MKPEFDYQEFDYQGLAARLVATAHRAGRAEMEIYRQDFETEYKADASPVTEADRLAEEIILRDLARIAPEIPVIAEEEAAAGRIPDVGGVFFLVDPLDGTKEFIRKNDEFTVNIALIEQDAPTFGLVYAPALGSLYLTFGADAAGYARMDPDGPEPVFDEMEFTPLKTVCAGDAGLNVVASKSHMTDETKRYLEGFQVKDLKSAGSSLKFCLLAAGEADLYPRFGPTMEWDTAAGHAVLRAAGGEVLCEGGAPLRYGKRAENYRNPYFIAWGQPPASPT